MLVGASKGACLSIELYFSLSVLGKGSCLLSDVVPIHCRYSMRVASSSLPFLVISVFLKPE